MSDGVRVKGLRETVRRLESFGVDVAELRDAMHGIGAAGARRVAAAAPRRTGRLAGTVRATRGKARAAVRAGGARAHYAGIVNYGSQHVAPRRFLSAAVAGQESAIVRQLDQALSTLIRTHNL